MAYISFQPKDHFSANIWTADGTDDRAITGLGFRPDLVWLKDRDQAVGHDWYDIVRGAGYFLQSNTNNAQNGSVQYGVKSFDSDGFTLGNSWGNISSGDDYVAWNWKAGNSQGSSNTDGSINTTYTSVNTTAGFSISKYTGTGSNATIGHGLGTTPSVVLVKRLDSSSDWRMLHKSTSGSLGHKQLFLNGTGAEDDDNAIWNDTAPTSSVFSVGTNTGSNASGGTYIAYCWAEKKGYSKINVYEGNENADGTFVYLGFRPAFILIKNRGSAGKDWFIHDNKRLGYNPNNWALQANLTNTDATNTVDLDLLSNGFKLRRNTAQLNHNGNFYIYMAFAEQPLVSSNGIPAVAR